jgi:hypothetical protein
MPMNKKSTLIYQFSTFNPSQNVLFDLNEFLKAEAKMRDRLKGLKKFKLKGPRIKVLEKYNIL